MKRYLQDAAWHGSTRNLSYTLEVRLCCKFSILWFPGMAHQAEKAAHSCSAAACISAQETSTPDTNNCHLWMYIKCSNFLHQGCLPHLQIRKVPHCMTVVYLFDFFFKTNRCSTWALSSWGCIAAIQEHKQHHNHAGQGLQWRHPRCQCSSDQSQMLAHSRQASSRLWCLHPGLCGTPQTSCSPYGTCRFHNSVF